MASVTWCHSQMTWRRTCLKPYPEQMMTSSWCTCFTKILMGINIINTGWILFSRPFQRRSSPKRRLYQFESDWCVRIPNLPIRTCRTSLCFWHQNIRLQHGNNHHYFYKERSTWFLNRIVTSLDSCDRSTRVHILINGIGPYGRSGRI